jgi:hypothetical protein
MVASARTLAGLATPAVRIVVHVRDPSDDPAPQPAETLQVGPSRPPLLEKIPTEWRQHLVVVLSFVLGVAAGGGVVLWWQDRPEPPPFRAG